MVSEIGMNLTALEGLQSPNITISTTGTDILQKMPETANTLTDGWLTMGILLVFSIMLFWVLADKTPFADFGYSDARAGAISFMLAANFGIMLAMVGWMAGIRAIGFFQVGSILWLIFIQWYENRE